MKIGEKYRSNNFSANQTALKSNSLLSDLEMLTRTCFPIHWQVSREDFDGSSLLTIIFSYALELTSLKCSALKF
jgi:hypothetical protein